MTLQAFIDDSGGTHGPTFVLGGFISTPEKWERFTDAWAEALADSPSIRYYKNSQAMSRQDEFKGWPYIDVQKKIYRLVKVIIPHVTHRVSVAINHDEFNWHLRYNELESLSNPSYYTLFFGVIGRIIKYLDEQVDRHPVSFVFDQQGKIGHSAAEMVRLMRDHTHTPLTKRQSELLMGVPTFADDKQATQLQAADLYAGNVRRFYIDNRQLYMPLRQHMRELMAIPGIVETVNARSIAFSTARTLINFYHEKLRESEC